MLGYKFWQRQFGGDPGVLGRKLRLNDKVRTVIGVMPPRFMWRGADVYLPDVFHRGQTVEGERSVHLLGRLKPGSRGNRRRPALKPLLEDMVARAPGRFSQEMADTRCGPSARRSPAILQDALWILFGAVGLLLADRMR